MFTKSKPDQGPSTNAMSSGLGIPPTPPLPGTDPRPSSEPLRPASASSGSRSTSLSTLSQGVKYEGNISGGGELQVDGVLKGDIRVARVTIGEGGAVEGAITAEVIDVRGKVAGSIVAKTVKLFASARVDGDITQEQLSIEQGAWFQGRCIQAKREAAAAPVAEAAPVDRYQPEKPVAPAMPGAKVEAKAPA